MYIVYTFLHMHTHLSDFTVPIYRNLQSEYSSFTDVERVHTWQGQYRLISLKEAVLLERIYPIRYILYNEKKVNT